VGVGWPAKGRGEPTDVRSVFAIGSTRLLLDSFFSRDLGHIALLNSSKFLVYALMYCRTRTLLELPRKDFAFKNKKVCQDLGNSCQMPDLHSQKIKNAPQAELTRENTKWAARDHFLCADKNCHFGGLCGQNLTF